MALQNGFKILNVQIIDGGGGFAGSTTYTLSFRDRVGQGTGAAGTVTTDAAGTITTSSISNRGKNYSSGSWEGLANNTGTPAIKGNFTTIGVLDAPGSGSILIPVIGMDTSMSISDINVERGFSSNAANSDIHDLYNDFASRIEGASPCLPAEICFSPIWIMPFKNVPVVIITLLELIIFPDPHITPIT